MRKADKMSEENGNNAFAALNGIKHVKWVSESTMHCGFNFYDELNSLRCIS